MPPALPLTRRDFLKLGAAAGLGLALSGCYPDCDISWQPNILAPVFYGIQDLDESAGAPATLRIFYPSLEGSPSGAPLLAGCGEYPLIVFTHGHCGELNHFQKWFLIPAQLARCGYVVAVPLLPDTSLGTFPWADANRDLPLLVDLVDWVRTGWDGREVLAPETGVAGHSYGGLMAGRLAVEIGAAAYAGLSAVWRDWLPPPPLPLPDLAAPAFFCWGTDDLVNAVLSGSGAGPWNVTNPPKHQVVFDGAAHWDYLPPGATTCEGFRGNCNLVQSLAADLTAAFFSKYMPPERATRLSTRIPASLVPPPLDLSDEQAFFAGGHLFGLAQIAGNADCTLTHTWTLAGGETGSMTLP